MILNLTFLNGKVDSQPKYKMLTVRQWGKYNNSNAYLGPVIANWNLVKTDQINIRLFYYKMFNLN